MYPWIDESTLKVRQKTQSDPHQIFLAEFPILPKSNDTTGLFLIRSPFSSAQLAITRYSEQPVLQGHQSARQSCSCVRVDVLFRTVNSKMQSNTAKGSSLCILEYCFWLRHEQILPGACQGGCPSPLWHSRRSAACGRPQVQKQSCY